MLPDSRNTGHKYLKEADWDNTCCPTCHVPEAVPSKITTSGMEGLRVRPAAKMNESRMTQSAPNDTGNAQPSACHSETKQPLPAHQALELYAGFFLLLGS